MAPSTSRQLPGLLPIAMLLAFTTVLVWTLPAAQTEMPYSVSDLGTFGGWFSIARGVNSHGQIVGESDTNRDTGSAFLYTAGTMTNLGTLGGTESSAWGINDAGQVVGQANLEGDFAHHAFLYNLGNMMDLGNSGWHQQRCLQYQ